MMRKPMTRKLRATPEKEGQIMNRATLAWLAAIIALLGFGAAAGHDVNHQGRPPVQADASRLPVRVVDRPVVDQDGITRSFGKDVVGDHLVVMDFIYTSCGTLCPLQSAILADLQNK